MLSIGEFSKICEVSTKTLRYYDEIGLIRPNEINPQNGYRYYSISQLETMLLINRLKMYRFSLEEIKTLMDSAEMQEAILYDKLKEKKKAFVKKVESYHQTMKQLDEDLLALQSGKSLMSYLDDIQVQLVEMPDMHLISMRMMVHKQDFPEQYEYCFHALMKKIENEKLTILAPPMVLFHSDEFYTFGLDTEFAIPVQPYTTESRIFQPGLCIKTTLHGAYTNLPSIYTKQCEWAAQNGYVNNGALYEVYITDPSVTLDENKFITEVYYPVKKQSTKGE